MSSSLFARVAMPTLLVLAIGSMAAAHAAKPAVKADSIKPVSLTVKAPAPADKEATKTAPEAVDNSEREIWRHHGVG